MHHEPRASAEDDAIRRLGEAFLGLELPKMAWTHEAHLVTCAWIIIERPDINPEEALPELIRRYNLSAGGINSDTEGYHETITQASILGIRHALRRSEGLGLSDRINTLLHAPEGHRNWLLEYYSRERLFSKEARLGWVEPDLQSLPGSD